MGIKAAEVGEKSDGTPSAGQAGSSVKSGEKAGETSEKAGEKDGDVSAGTQKKKSVAFYKEI